MAFYESVIVFRQDLNDAQVREKADKFEKIIKELSGSVSAKEFWGLRTLAYIIRKNKRAHYVMFGTSLPGAQLAEFERKMRIDEDVIRFLNVRVEKLAKGPSIMMKSSEEA
ncbi:MAG: 30S ribosomal protein S6 [Rickettsiales bacterium]|jgi:small subunit ribosomal protein S6|nr:30S ribosomal protein S6 [Rickettsiales bacterium]